MKDICNELICFGNCSFAHHAPLGITSRIQCLLLRVEFVFHLALIVEPFFGERLSNLNLGVECQIFNCLCEKSPDFNKVKESICVGAALAEVDFELFVHDVSLRCPFILCEKGLYSNTVDDLPLSLTQSILIGTLHSCLPVQFHFDFLLNSI